MSNLNDLMKFWGEDSIVAKRATKAKKPPYKLPDVELDDGSNAFEVVARYLTQSNPNLLNKQGFIDLDELWAKTGDDYLKAYQDELLAEYPKPFGGRKVYLIRVGLDTKKETGDGGVIVKKTVKGLTTKERDDKSKYARFGGYVCSFESQDLGYNPRANSKEMGVNNEGELTKVENLDPYYYLYTTFYIDDELGKKKLYKYIKQKIDEDNTRFYVPCFAITYNLNRGDLKDTENPPANPSVSDYWHSMSIDDVILP